MTDRLYILQVVAFVQYLLEMCVLPDLFLLKLVYVSYQCRWMEWWWEHSLFEMLYHKGFEHNCNREIFYLLSGTRICSNTHGLFIANNLYCSSSHGLGSSTLIDSGQGSNCEATLVIRDCFLARWLQFLLALVKWVNWDCFQLARTWLIPRL